jgi:hypothetical protein
MVEQGRIPPKGLGHDARANGDTGQFLTVLQLNNDINSPLLKSLVPLWCGKLRTARNARDEKGD